MKTQWNSTKAVRERNIYCLSCLWNSKQKNRIVSSFYGKCLYVSITVDKILEMLYSFVDIFFSILKSNTAFMECQHANESQHGMTDSSTAKYQILIFWQTSILFQVAELVFGSSVTLNELNPVWKNRIKNLLKPKKNL